MKQPTDRQLTDKQPAARQPAGAIDAAAVKAGPFHIALLPGDGIGPEVIGEAVKVLRAVGKKYAREFAFTEGLIGGMATDTVGIPLPDTTLDMCQRSDAVLLGAVGGPKWDDLPSHLRPEAALLAIRKALQVFANLRPVRLFPALIGASTLKAEIVGGVDLVVVRELTGGAYFGQPKGRFGEGDAVRAVDTMAYTRPEVERIARVAFDLAGKRRRKVTSVDKAANLHTILKGENPNNLESVPDTSVRYKEISFTRSVEDSILRLQIEEEELFNLSLMEVKSENEKLSSLHFFPPVKGMITNSFNIQQNHFGVDIAAPPNEVVVAIADGTVILSSWTLETGYVIQIQHDKNLLSVYKHNSKLLKLAGTKVRTGEAIAIVGNSGELTTGPHLHFELWHNGTPVNPEQYIVF